MSDITVKQALEGFIIEDMSERVNKLEDPIDLLMNYNIEEVNVDTIVRVESYDNSDFEKLDAYGTLPSGAVAHFADRNYRKQVLTIPKSEEKVFKIARDDFQKYKIDFGMLDLGGDSASEIALGLYNNLKKEINTLVTDAYAYERGKIHTVLDELGNSSDPFVCPFNEQIIATSRSNGIWNFSNKGTAALGTNSFASCYDSFAKNVDIKGQETGQHVPRVLLVTGSTSLAEELLNPDQIKDITLRSLADKGGAVPKMVGTYRPADSSESNDWVCLSNYPFEKKTFRRIVSGQYKSVNAEGITLQGWKIDIYEDKPKNQIVISIQGRSQFAIESPVGFYKGVVPNS